MRHAYLYLSLQLKVFAWVILLKYDRLVSYNLKICNGFWMSVAIISTLCRIRNFIINLRSWRRLRVMCSCLWMAGINLEAAFYTCWCFFMGLVIQWSITVIQSADYQCLASLAHPRQHFLLNWEVLGSYSNQVQWVARSL